VTPVEPWLVEQLIAKGVMTEDRVTRRATVRACPRCGRWTFRGLDGDVAAFDTSVDLAPLSAFGELVARTAEIDTYSLRYIGGRYEIDPRTAMEIRLKPPGSAVGEDVVARHVCGVDIRLAGPSRIDARKPDAVTVRNSDDPSF
jgi:hypothetical protein